MPSHEKVLNKLREKGYRFKRQHGHVDLYKKGTHRVIIPRNADHPDAWVRTTFRQCGCSEEEIGEFLRVCNT